MNEFTQKVRKAKELLTAAEAILVGAGAGLTASAGIDYGGKEFRASFADYIAKYKFTDLYSSGFYPFATDAERWAYWARHVNFVRLAPPALPLYLELRELIAGKSFFVLTTNVDGQFFKAGFEPDRVMAFQGDYAQMQCARACHDMVYDNTHAVGEILAHSRDLTVAEEFVPRCPVCKGPMEMHLRKDDFFIEDQAWHDAWKRYRSFVARYAAGKLGLLEIGVGFNTPGIIRYPFERMALANPKAALIRINSEEAWLPPKLAYRSVGFQEDASKVISALLAP